MVAVREKKRLWKREKILEQKIGMGQKTKTPLKGMGLQASRPGIRNKGNRIPKILQKQKRKRMLLMVLIETRYI